jgi:membrane protein required for colicin V production
MHLFDIIIIIVAAIFILLGIKRGLIEEIFHLAAMVGGFIGAYFSYSIIFNRLQFLKTTDRVKTVIAFVLAYIVITFTILVCGWLLRKLIHMTPLGWIDRLAGGILGFFKGAILIWIFVLSVSLLPKSQVKSSFSSSFFYKLLNKLPIQLKVPSADKLRKSYNKIKKSIPVDKIVNAKDKISKLQSKIETVEENTDSALAGK